MPKYREKPIKPKEVEAMQYKGFESLEEVRDFTGFATLEIHDLNGPFETLTIKDEITGYTELEIEIGKGNYLVKYSPRNFRVYSPDAFKDKFESVDSAKKARKMAELSGMLTKNGFNFKETPKEEEIEKVESFEFNFDGKTKSKIEYKTMKDGSRYHTERAFFNFELDDNLREELQSIIGRIAEHFFENDKTLPMIEHTGITNAKITNSPSLAIATNGINADFSGAKLDIPVKTAKIKDLSADKIKPGPIESSEISPANSFEIEREAHKKLIKELIREVLSEKPVTVSLDGEEVGKACFKEASKVMKRQDMRSK
ncbi:hypothetical protein [Bacillus paralicheniformis]|uniref:hypothetical protein n=1 Tax=Bacillus paralicheniformis TaxID=1648923 RepID=UPI0022435538|nr:hypothetical protein [Bacillus paralicheniformis]UZN53022.1 hypothetical protein OPU65_13545 [Bacillus paralicheniformis]